MAKYAMPPVQFGGQSDFNLPLYLDPSSVPVSPSNAWGMPAEDFSPMAAWGNAPSAAAPGFAVDTSGFSLPQLQPQGDPSLWGRFRTGLQDSGFLGSKDANGVETQGWGGMALGAASGLANAYMGMQQLKLAKETLSQNKAQFEKNFDAQRTTTNTALEDRQRARVASNGAAYESVGQYMDKNRVR